MTDWTPNQTAPDMATHALVKAANAVLGHVIVENGSDIDVDGDGKLTLGGHKTRHENNGNDEIDIGGLSAASDVDLNSNKITALADPTIATDAVNKEYVDMAVAAARWDYYFNDTSASISTYYEMSPLPTGDAKSELETPSALGTGDDQPLFQWISDAVVPVATIEQGVINVHVHAERTLGNRDIVLYATIHEYKADTSEALIATTEDSEAVIDSEEHMSFHVILADDYEIAITSKLLIKFFANISGGGQNVKIKLYFEGQTASRVTVPVPSAAFDAVYIKHSILDAYSIMATDTDDTPDSVVLSASEMIGRKSTGGIVALSASDVKTVLSLNNVENTQHSTDAHTMTIDGIDVSAHDVATTGVHGAGGDTIATDADISTHAGLTDPHTGYVLESLADAENDFLVASGDNVFVKKTLAETKVILDVTDSARALAFALSS